MLDTQKLEDLERILLEVRHQAFKQRHTSVNIQFFFICHIFPPYSFSGF